MLLEGQESLLSSSASKSRKETRDVGVQVTSKCDQQCVWIALLLRDTVHFNDLLLVCVV